VARVAKRADEWTRLLLTPGPTLHAGVYFIRQWDSGLAFFDDVWLPMQDKRIGHDQDGFNWVVRGGFFREEIREAATFPPDPSLRVLYAAFSNATAVAFLPPSMFANTYTYVNARLWEVGERGGKVQSGRWVLQHDSAVDPIYGTSKC
jgi:hypothetical protein